jgi:hypothetical protein
MTGWTERVDEADSCGPAAGCNEFQRHARRAVRLVRRLD